MTEVAFIKNLLESQWETSITGRGTDVPNPDASPPEIEWTLQKEKANARIRNQDVGYVASGGDTNHTPRGFGWTHQDIDTLVAVEYRAATREDATGYTNGYERLVGQRTGSDGLGEPDRWDGIVGETKRVLLADRKGRSEWDLIGADALRVVDNVDTGGKNYYRVDVVVGLRNNADPIDTST